MNLKDDIKPITYLKNNAAKVVRDVSRSGRSLVITQNGEAAAVVMGITQYEQWRKSLAMMKLLSLREAEAAAGKGIPQDEAFERAYEKIRQIAQDG
ncbi:MAG: type II toxin-antitoxin system Phd/YefM family antitoxin [Deltaproteobacteria bacterium]|nr:type II toxin-antitoxin system Phd/YefM family antitoxin [Deltaproteobacteria bacterium]